MKRRYRVTATNDKCTVTLFTFHDGHLGLTGAKRFAADVRRRIGNQYTVEIVTEPDTEARL
jgi:hypothetical protein